MVKGVNKTVIEISCTDNGYFERAILFVNPEQSHISQKRLYSEAKRYIDSISLNESKSQLKGTVMSSKKIPRRYPIKLVMALFALTLAAGALFIILNSL